MTLLDTNVLIYACDPASPHAAWAKEVIVAAVTGDGAAINAVGLTEICVGDAEPETVADRIRSWGVEILAAPSAADGQVGRGCQYPTPVVSSARDRQTPPRRHGFARRELHHVIAGGKVEALQADPRHAAVPHQASVCP